MSLNVMPGMIPEWSIADRMRKAREMRDLSQTEFAEATGLSRRTVSRIESGDKTPATKDYNLWQMATGVPRVWLETGAAPSGGDGADPSRPRESNPRPFHYMRQGSVAHLQKVA